LEDETGCGISDAIDEMGVWFGFEADEEGYIDYTYILKYSGLHDRSAESFTEVMLMFRITL
jgi:hypothetical protein